MKWHLFLSLCLWVFGLFLSMKSMNVQIAYPSMQTNQLRSTVTIGDKVSKSYTMSLSIFFSQRNKTLQIMENHKKEMVKEAISLGFLK